MKIKSFYLFLILSLLFYSYKLERTENICKSCEISEICKECLSRVERGIEVVETSSKKYSTSKNRQYCDGKSKSSIERSGEYLKLLFLTVGDLNNASTSSNIELKVNQNKVCIRGRDLTEYYQFDAYLEAAGSIVVEASKMPKRKELAFWATNSKSNNTPKFYTPVYVTIPNQNDNYLYVGFEGDIGPNHRAYYKCGSNVKSITEIFEIGDAYYIKIPMEKIQHLPEFVFSLEEVDASFRIHSLLKENITIKL